MDKKVIKEQLVKTYCYRCQGSLEGANFVPISELPVAVTAHVTCPNCKAESMLTITMNGSGVLPVATDLTPEEIKTSFGKTAITAEEVVTLHKTLKKESLWNLMQLKEQNLEKRTKK